MPNLNMMIIYHTTYHLSNEAYLTGVDFFKSVFIPVATHSGKLFGPRMMRVLNEDPEVNGVSLSLQFCVDDITTLEEWMSDEGQALHKMLTDKFIDEITGFSTLLEEV